MSYLSPELSAQTSHRAAAERRRPSALGLRLRVFFRQGSLDEMLAAGTPPEKSPELSMRARQLTRARHRSRLAGGLEHAVENAERRSVGRSASPPLAHRDVRACRAALLGLARDLRSAADLHPAGLAAANRLLTDGRSPLYNCGYDDELWRTVRDAELLLRTGGRF